MRIIYAKSYRVDKPFVKVDGLYYAHENGLEGFTHRFWQDNTLFRNYMGRGEDTSEIQFPWELDIEFLLQLSNLAGFCNFAIKSEARGEQRN